MIAFEDDRVVLYHGDCRRELAALPDDSIDAVVTDPPYELTSGGKGGFMGAHWDATGVAFDRSMWEEVLRVLRPGGHAVIFGATRTWHRVAVAVEDAGFEIRDNLLAWSYGSGFPKARRPLELDIIPAIEAQLREQGVEGDIVWRRPSRATIAERP